MKMAIAMILVLFSFNALANVHVRGYTHNNGTYVSPHYRSNPNHSTQDNWSTKGNVNPYTGKEGYKNPNSMNNY